MKPFVQSRLLPCQIPIAFDEAVLGNVSGFRWAVAYISIAGCNLMAPRLEQGIGRRWNSIEKVIVTSCDYGITDPEAVDALRGWPNCTVLLASPDVLNRPRLIPLAAFHPKLYIFDKDPGHAIIVGSANLTARGMSTNTEVIGLYSGAGAADTWDSVWAASIQGAVEFTPELLSHYRRVRRGLPTSEILEPPPSPTGPLDPGSLPVFWDEIAAGRLIPGDFTHFWVEAGSMSSSASHNQLELPRGANRFFNFSFSRYDHSQAEIGRPRLVVRGRTFPNRKLAWHGDNGMERIYLPTQHQSNLVYQDQCVLFRRTRAGFALYVFPWDSALAFACRSASQQTGQLFRLGGRSPRVCGLY